MERHFEQEFAALKDQLLAMGGRAENIVQKAMAALKTRNVALANEVFADDRQIDALE